MSIVLRLTTAFFPSSTSSSSSFSVFLHHTTVKVDTTTQLGMALGDATSSWEQFLDSPLLPLEDLVSSPPRSKRTHAEAFPMSGAIRSSPILLVCHDTLCFTTYHLPNLSLFVSRADFLYPSHLQPMTRNQRPHLSPAPILLPLLLRMNPPLRCHPTRQQHMDVLLGLCSLQQLRKPLRPVQAASDYLLLSQIFSVGLLCSPMSLYTCGT